MLHPTVTSFWTRSTGGRIIRANATAGSALGLHATAAVDHVLALADAGFRTALAAVVAGQPPPDEDEVLRQITGIRFPPGAGSHPRDPIAGAVGFHDLGRPDLSGVTLATIKPLHHLHNLLGPDGIDRIVSSRRLRAAGLRVQLPTGDKERVSDETTRGLRLLRPKEREFNLAPRSSGGRYPVSLGSGLLWFTTTRQVARLRRAGRHPDGEADRVRDGLGLVRESAGRWLMIVTFPGIVAQSRGHYRPVFCDPHGYPRFMAGSSRPARRRPGAWGQTADLHPIEDLAAALPAGFDGGRERVVPELDASHFGPLRARFELLGQLARTRRADADSNLAFADRLDRRNLRP